MKSVATITFLSILHLASAGVEKQISKKEYVEQWKATAIQQMIQYKIPASITLSQAILESGSGNSELATKGNNHFGIKCHDWTGETMYMDDDEKGECFRVYKNADESYKDHSEFLKNRKRYSQLFEFEITDYEKWAKGLKDAGYATNPKYPEMLIEIIEDLNLNELDKLGLQNNVNQPSIVVNKENTSSENVADFSTAHQVMQHENKVKYVVVKKGDTFYRISKEFGLTLSQLYKYNDYGKKKDVLEVGDIVYIQPKRNRSKNKSIVLAKDMTVFQISQFEAVDSDKILKRNDIDSPETIVKKGEKIILR